jgi:hypothetical protein
VNRTFIVITITITSIVGASADSDNAGLKEPSGAPSRWLNLSQSLGHFLHPVPCLVARIRDKICIYDETGPGSSCYDAQPGELHEDEPLCYQWRPAVIQNCRLWTWEGRAYGDLAGSRVEDLRKLTKEAPVVEFAMSTCIKPDTTK